MIMELKTKIEIYRHELQVLWDKKQKTDSEVLHVARELDSLINEYCKRIQKSQKL